MGNTLFVGKVLHTFETLPSTNDYALDLLAKSTPPEGTAVLADNQTAGRGQYGSRWYSAPGENLLVSIILYPTWLKLAEQWLLSEAMAVATRDAVTEITALSAAIKWPNDIYLNTRKTGGILIQCGLHSAHWQHAVVGIGLNVNQRYFPAEAPNATSLALACGRSFDRAQVLEHLFEAVEQRYLQLRKGQKALLRQAYRQHLLGFGQRRTFAYPDGRLFEATAVDVSPEGRLLLETSNGLVAFDRKEVVWRFEDTPMDV